MAFARFIFYTSAMSFEQPSLGSRELPNLDEIGKFADLFAAINAAKLPEVYRNAYEEAVSVAKDHADSKGRSEWNPYDFTREIARAYPEISDHFIAALRRCVTSYAPPVNIPDAPLWE